MSEIVTIVLAAGRGDRLGGPKALLEWPVAVEAGHGRIVAKGGPVLPLAIAHAERRLAAESKRVIIVSRKAFMTPLLGFIRPGIDLVASDAPDEQGPAGSLAAVAARVSPTDIVIVTPVDTVPALTETVAALLARIEGPDAPLAARPRCRDRNGHPVVMRASLLDRYRLPDPPPLRDHLRALGPACADVVVDDPSVLADLDVPADLVRALGSLPRFFSWRK